MARTIRWTIPFKSLNGTNCRIDIYDEGWSGGATELSPNNVNAPGYAARNPIEWQEDEDEDLLSVVRYKTGYIRLIEKSSGSLNSLYPSTNLQHYVEFYYGSTLAFNGYIQAQSFENSWSAPPREVNLPIISPVGVAAGLMMNVVTPGNYTIGSLLKNAIDQLNANYTYVLFPDVSPAFTGIIKSIVPIPLNGDFDYFESGSGDVYSPCYIIDYLEGICNAYGWMLHDEPGRLVFSKFDYNGMYVKIWTSNLPAGSPVSDVVAGNTVAAFDNFYAVAGSDNTISTILPLNEIEVDFGGRPFSSADYGFTRISHQRTDTSYGLTAVWMKPYGPEISGTLDSNTLTGMDSLGAHGVNICAIGRSNDLKKMILIYETPTSSGTHLFTYRCYDVPKANQKGVFNISIDGMACKDLYFESGDTTGYSLLCSIRAGSKYLLYDPTYLGGNSWVDYEEKNNVFIGSQNIVPIDVVSLPACEYVELNFYTYPMPQDVKFEAITSISISLTNNGASDFDISQTTQKHLYGNNGSQESGSVKMMFSAQREFLNSIGYNKLSLFTDYSYMFVSQTRLKVMVKATTVYDYLYLIKWTYWVANWHWRIIAVSFDPWNDTYTIVLHRSSTI